MSADYPTATEKELSIAELTKTANAMASSSGRPIRMRMRNDLVAKRQTWQGREYWILKDPVAMKYYRFEDEEYQLLQMLDGDISPDEIKLQFDYQFAPQKITMPELFQLIGMLYRNSLVLSDGSDQGRSLLERSKKVAQSKRRQSITSVMSLKFRGFDPDRLLTWMNSYTWWFFTWPAFFLVLIMGLGAGGLLLTHFEDFQNRLPSFQDFFAANNWFYLAIVLGLTKVFHEFGHGLACKRFGGQCHEMGVMFLVFTPCLYANVSDSWLLDSKWKRAFIAAAGMYVELVLATVAVFVWWFSHPGMVNQLALNLIMVCSVSTLLFNANPLLRYDGYYILSDLLEIPNLRRKASAVLNRFGGSFFLGLPSQEDPFLPSRHQWAFGLYAVMAVAYRWVITFSIFWFVYRVLEPYGLKIIGQMLAMISIWGLLGMPIYQLYKYFSVPGRTAMIKRARVGMTLVAVATLLGFIMLIPIPRYVYCPFMVEARDVANVYVDQPGVLTHVFVQPNQFVEENDGLVRLSNSAVDYQLVQMAGTYQAAFRQVEISELAEARGWQGELPSAEAKAALATSDANLSKKEEDWERLVVLAPRKGFLLTGHRKPIPEPDGALNTWHGTPTEPRNIGALLDGETVVAQIVPDMNQLKAVLAIDQSEIEFVQNDQSVSLLVYQNQAHIIESATKEISPAEMQSVPKALSSRFGGDLVTTQDGDGGDHPLSTTFQVNVPFDLDPEFAGTVLPGSTGMAKVHTGTQTVGMRIWRLVCQTFQFEL